MAKDIAKNNSSATVKVSTNPANSKPANAVAPASGERLAAVAKSPEVNSSSIVLAAVVILLLLAGIGFLLFGLVQGLNNSNSNPNNNPNNNQDQQATTNSEGDGSGVSVEGQSDQVDGAADANPVPAPAANTTPAANPVPAPAANTTPAANPVPATPLNKVRFSGSDYSSTNSTYRRGNDYKFGDITGDRYVVRKGDTLWQIAEGKYGAGGAWVEINRANGGFPLLRSGQPVNIPVGYNLVLPSAS